MKKENAKKIMEERIAIIKKFAQDMGYTVDEDTYKSCVNSRPMYAIYLNETSDGEGEPYGWAWYLDTYKPHHN